MKKEVVVFDKDGTLLDFDAFWVSVSVDAVKDVLKKVNMEELDIEKFLYAFGVEDGVTDIDGILCKGTYEQLGTAVYNILKEHGCDKSAEDIISMLIGAYNDNSDSGRVEPTCENIREVLEKLKDDGRKLVVVTTDNYEITYKCLEKLDIKDLFDAVYADDGIIPTKPNPHYILKYCEESGISADKVVMVGDTMTDVNFARNAGISVIGVGATEKNRQRLLGFADVVIDDISHIPEVIEEI